MTKSISDPIGPGRYYANAQEQKVLVQGLQSYFALPERSQNRNKIAKEVSRFLRFFSPHWTHRAVRLWFNNNRHTYFPSDQTGALPPKPEPPPPPPPPPPGVSPKPNSPELSLPSLATAPPPSAFSVYDQPLPSTQIWSPIPPDPVPPKLQGSPQTPPGSPRPKLIVPTSPTTHFPLSPTALPFPKSPPQKTVSVVSLPGPTQPPNPALQFQSLKPVSFWQPGQQKEQTPEQLYIPMSTMLNELRRIPENDPRLAAQIADFDNGCLRIISKFGSIKAEKIEPMLRYVKFPFPTAESSEFKFGLISESISSEFSEFALRAPSFTQQLYAADIPRDPSSEQCAWRNIWQSRPFDDVKLDYFECAAVNAECAAVISAPITAHQKLIQFMRYRESPGAWHRIPVDAHGSVDALCVGGEVAWVLSDSVVRGVPLASGESAIAARLPIFGSGNLTLFRDGAVAAFPTSAMLFFVSARGTARQIPVQSRGVACLTAVGDSLVCGATQSGTVRMVAADGRDERAFVGHCGPVLGLESLGGPLFASRGEDETVRVWDVRQRNPIASVLLPHISVCSMAGSEGYLICGFHNKRLGVVELRKDHGKAVLGVQTQDYMAVAMNYDARTDQLAMFGLVDKEPIQNSMVFVDNDVQSRQRIFRRYTNFIGMDLMRGVEGV
jgi:hypothetical protein